MLDEVRGGGIKGGEHVKGNSDLKIYLHPE